MFAFAIFEHAQRAAGPGPGPARASSRSTSTRHPTGCASPRPCRRCWPAAAPTPRSTRSALAYYMTFHSRRAGAADDPDGRPQAAAGHRPGRSSRTATSHDIALLGRRSSPATRTSADWTEQDWQDALLEHAADGGRAPDGRRRAGRGAAVRRHRLQPGRRAAGRGRAARPEDVQHRLRLRRRRVRATSSSTRPWWPSTSTPTTTGSRSTARRLLPGHRRGHRGDERADGQPRLRRVLPAQPGRVAKHVKVVQSGQGADEVLGGYDWYPPLAVGAADGRRRGVLAGSSSTGAGRRWARSLNPDWLVDRRRADRLHQPSASAGPGAETVGRRRAAQRHHDHAGRRPGEAGRQHDHGVGAGGPGAVPRPRAGRARRPDPAGAQARRRRQGRAQAGEPRRRARRGDRPDQGLLPGAGHPPARGPLPGPGARRADRSGGPAARTVPRRRRATACSPIPTPPGRRWARTRCGSWPCWRCGCSTMDIAG